MRRLGARLAALVVHRPRAVLLVAFALALAVVPLSLRLRLDTNLVDMLPVRSREAAAFSRFTRLFGGEQLLIVLVESQDPARLGPFADRYAAALAARPDVSEVRVRLSLAAARVLRDHLLDLLDDDEQDTLAARATPEKLAAQAKRLRSLLTAPGGSSLAPLLTADPLEVLPLLGSRLSAGLPIDPRSGYYKSADGKALLLFVQPKTSPFDIESDRRLLDGATQAARSLGARVDDQYALLPAPPDGTPTVGFTGSYAYALAYRDWLHRDMQLSTVLSASAVLLFFAVLLGALRALPLVAIPLFVGLWFDAALAAALYGRVNAVSLAFGTILLSIGIDLPIQLYNRLREELETQPPAVALERTIGELAGPALLATLGPTVVFLACALSDYKGLAELGVLAGAGLLLNLVVMLTIFPALLSVVPARLWMSRNRKSASGAWFAALGRVAARRPRTVLAGVAIAVTALAPMALRVRVEKRLISIEPPSMPPATVRRELEQRFGGRDRLLVVLSEGASNEAAMEKSDRWRARADGLRRRGLLVGYESVSSLFPSEAEVRRRRARLASRGLDPARLARDLRSALAEAGFDEAPFAPFFVQLDHPPAPLAASDAGPDLSFLVRAHLKPDGAATVATTFLYPAPGRFEEADAALQQLVAADPADGELTGQSILEEALYQVVRRDTVRVTTAAVLAVILLLGLYYRRLRPALAVLLPLGVAWILFAAALGALGLPLNLFDLLTVPLVVGYGIDDHVFLVHRHEEDPGAGPARALASTGRAIVVTSLSTMAGFAGLAAAHFDGLRLLGITGTLAVALCLLAAFAVLPALLALLYPIDAVSSPRR